MAASAQRAGRCFAVEEATGGRPAFGLCANLYSVRGRRDLGVGGLAEVRELVEFAADVGASFVGLSPLHALRNHPPDVSPYSPSSRLFANPLYLDLERVPELAACREARERMASRAWRDRAWRLAAASSVDYAGVEALRRPVLRALHASFARAPASSGRRRAYALWRARQGAPLADWAVFRALEEDAAARSGPADARDWTHWPAELRDPRSAAVRAFAEAHEDEVGFHAWLQFELDRQLAELSATARAAGLALGLYFDLAVGSSPSGFDTWAFGELFARDARIGAPPDAYAAEGQDWGLPPLRPESIADSAYWSALLERSLEHPGALRIDHVMGLIRLWWVPLGRSAREGAYVPYPARELLASLAAASRRHRTVVIGEDLGTLPHGLAARLARRAVLSTRVLLFERDRRGGFRAARRWSPRALATANTHDLPTLSAWWSGDDLALRARLGLIDAAALASARDERAHDRRALLRRLRRDLGPEVPGGDGPLPSFVAAVHAFLGATPAPLVGVSLDDLALEAEPVNVPGVGQDVYPSWKRRMARSVDSLRADPDVARMLGGLRARALHVR